MVAESSGSGVVYYIREPNGSLIARSDSTNGVRYYHFDQLGSTRVLTDSTGAVTDKYDYDAYGAVLWHELHTGSIDQPYQYVGQLGYYACWQEPDFDRCCLGCGFTIRKWEGLHSGIRRVRRTFYDYATENPESVTDASGLARGVQPRLLVQALRRALQQLLQLCMQRPG